MPAGGFGAAGSFGAGSDGPSFDNLPPAAASPQPAARRAAAPRTANKKAAKSKASAGRAPGPAASGAPPYRSTPARPKPKRKKPLNLKAPLIGFGVVMAVVVLGIGGYFAWDKLPTESLTALVPVMDSPEKILKDYADIADDLRSTLDSIQDEKSRDRAIPRLQAMTESCGELSRRAVDVGPLTHEKMESLGAWFKTQIPERSKRLKASTESVNQRRALMNGALTDVLFDLAFALGSVEGSLKTAWTPLAEPKNATQEVECEIIKLRRKIWGAVATAVDESDYQDLNGTYRDVADELEALMDEHLDTIESSNFMQPGSPYFGASVSYSVDTGFAFGKLSDKFGELSSTDGIEKYNSVSARLSSIQGSGGDGAGGMAGFGGGRPGGAGPGGFASSGDPSSRFGGAPGGPRFGGRPPGIPSADEAFGKRIERFRQMHGDDAVVVFRFKRKGNEARITDINRYLRGEMGAKMVQIQYRGEDGLGLCLCEEPVQGIADKIEWGTVTSVDDSERTIHVTIKPE